ncbi:MAG: SIR2 family protein [Isosphaeraceae bacterium]
MSGGLSERDWEILLNRFSDGTVVPFLGAGACHGTLPLGSEIAREWAAKYHYPFADDGDLVRVAQYLAIEYDPTYPKELILKRFKGVRPPDFRSPDEPHAVLAQQKLPIYLTTNYDDFMVQAIKAERNDPRREYCRWNDLTRLQPTVFQQEPNYRPSPANPLVFHLHGHTTPDSLVLTEDDYLSFLASLQDPALLPGPVRMALAEAKSLLFLGYRLADWNIRVLLQGLRGLSGQSSLSVMVMLPPEGSDADRQQKLQSYMERYYAAARLKVYWGTAREFCGELAGRLKAQPT